MHLEVSKPISLYDEKLSIRAKGLPIQSLVTFHLQVYDAAEELWQSKATFRVPEEGCLELDVMAPIEGSYTSVDGMGLFNSLRAAKTTIEHFFLPSQGLTYTLSVWAEGKKMANCFLHRLLQLPDTQK